MSKANKTVKLLHRSWNEQSSDYISLKSLAREMRVDESLGEPIEFGDPFEFTNWLARKANK